MFQSSSNRRSFETDIESIVDLDNNCASEKQIEEKSDERKQNSWVQHGGAARWRDRFAKEGGKPS